MFSEVFADGVLAVVFALYPIGVFGDGGFIFCSTDGCDRTGVDQFGDVVFEAGIDHVAGTDDVVLHEGVFVFSFEGDFCGAVKNSIYI